MTSDIRTNGWMFTGELGTPGFGKLLQLKDGRLLYIQEHGYEVFDPQTNAWSDFRDAAMNTKASLEGAAFVQLKDGRILSVSSRRGLIGSVRCFVFNPLTLTWTRTGDLNENRPKCDAYLLPNGTVMACGGWNVIGNQREPCKTAEIWSPCTETWKAIPSEPDLINTQGSFDLANKLVIHARSIDRWIEFEPENETWRRLSSVPNLKTLSCGMVKEYRLVDSSDSKTFFDIEDAFTTASRPITLRLKDGRVFCYGGQLEDIDHFEAPINSVGSIYAVPMCRIYYPDHDRRELRPNTKIPRYSEPDLCQLNDDRIMVIGGTDGSVNGRCLKSCEFIRPEDL